MEFSDIVYIGLVSGIVSSTILVVVMNQFINGIVDNFRDRMKDVLEDDKEIVDCYITFTDKSMLMYKVENNEFVAQGDTWEDLNKNTIARFPDLMFNVKTEQINKAMKFNK